MGVLWRFDVTLGGWMPTLTVHFLTTQQEWLSLALQRNSWRAGEVKGTLPVKPSMPSETFLHNSSLALLWISFLLRSMLILTYVSHSTHWSHIYSCRRRRSIKLTPKPYKLYNAPGQPHFTDLVRAKLMQSV